SYIILKGNIRPINLQKDKIIIYNESERNYELTADFKKPYLQIRSFKCSINGGDHIVFGYTIVTIDDKEYYAIKIDEKDKNNDPIEVKIKNLKNEKIYFLHKDNKKKVLLQADMFYYEKSYIKNIPAKTYKFEVINNKPTIILTFPDTNGTNGTNDTNLINEQKFLSTQISPPQQTSIDEKGESKKYDIKFAQSHQPITFEGNISEKEWSDEHIPSYLCALLQSIYIKNNTRSSLFLNFQKDNYLLNTEDKLEGEYQDVPIYICHDQKYNVGSLKIKNSINLNEANHIHEFNENDFKFIHDPNIKVKKIEKDFYPEKPSLLLMIENKKTGLEYEDKELEIKEYEFFIKKSGKYNISKKINNNDWKRSKKDTDYLFVKIDKYKFGNIYYNCYGRITEDAKYQIIVDLKEYDNGIPLYIYIKDDKNFEKTITFNYSNDKTVYKNTFEPITAKHFKLHDDNYIIRRIEPNYETSKPSLLLVIEKKVQKDSPGTTPPNSPTHISTYNIKSIKIMPFSDDMLNDDLKNKLKTKNIYKTCKKIIREFIKPKINVSLGKYPKNIEPFSIEAIEMPLPTIDNYFTDDPESIFKSINQKEPNQVLIIGHIEEDLMTNEIILCIRAFITKIDDRLTVKQSLKISNKNIREFEINMKNKVLELLNKLPNTQFIKKKYLSKKAPPAMASTSFFSQNLPSYNSLNKPKTITIWDIWNKIDEDSFDNKEYKTYSDIYDNNIKQDFFCTLQDYDYQLNQRNRLNSSEWINSFSRKAIIDKDDPFSNSFFIEVVSEHKKKYHKKTFLIIKSTNNTLNLIEADTKINHFNKIEFANINNWKIPTLEEITHLFQLKKYKQNILNIINLFMPKFTNVDKIYFWTSTFQDRKSKTIWQVSFKFNQIYNGKDFYKMDYDLEYHPTKSTEKAYLLPISIK
ncbi:hypothetical protein MHK_011022, partial [Candidatus Magnetomorum sp. HK-1]